MNNKKDIVKEYALEFNIAFFFKISQYLWEKKKKNYFWLFLYKTFAFFVISLYILICLFDILYIFMLCMSIYNLLSTFVIFPLLKLFFDLFLLIILTFYIIYFIFSGQLTYISKLWPMLLDYDNHVFYYIFKEKFLYFPSLSFMFFKEFLSATLNISKFNDSQVNSNKKFNEVIDLSIYFRKVPLNLYENKPFWVYLIIYLYLIIKLFAFLMLKYFFIMVIFVNPFLFYILYLFICWLLEFFIYKYIIVDLKNLNPIFIRCILQMSDEQLFKIFKQSFEFYNSKYTYEEFLNLELITYTLSISLNIEIHKRLIKYKKNLYLSNISNNIII